MYRAYVFTSVEHGNDLRYTETRHTDLVSALARFRSHKHAVLMTEYISLSHRGCTLKQIERFRHFARESVNKQDCETLVEIV